MVLTHQLTFCIKIGYKFEKEKIRIANLWQENKIMSRLLEEYKNNINPDLKTKLGLT